MLSPSEDQPHLVAAIDTICRGLGGLTRVWRFDRMATVCDPGSGRVTASFAGVVKHYGVSVAICPARRGNRKGVVEKVNHTAAQRWWRTLADEVTVEAAQASVDRFARVRGDSRLRAMADGPSSVAVVATTEPLSPLPVVPYPVIVSESRRASRQALVYYRGNRYSVPPELAAAEVTVSHPVGGEFCDIATRSGRWSATAATSSRWMQPRWRPRPPGAHTAAWNESHPEQPPKPLPHNYSTCTASTLHAPQHQLHQPIPLSSTCPPTSGPPRQGPCNDSHPTAPREPPPAPPQANHPRVRLAATNSCAHIWLSSNCTPPPKPCQPSWTRPPPKDSH